MRNFLSFLYNYCIPRYRADKKEVKGEVKREVKGGVKRDAKDSVHHNLDPSFPNPRHDIECLEYPALQHKREGKKEGEEGG